MSLNKTFTWRGIAAVVLVCAATAPAQGQQPAQTQQQEKKEHVVRKGDTLWDLAHFYFADPFRWPRIYDANRTVVANPHWIYPAERLVIPGTDPLTLLGRPVEMPPVAMVEEEPVSNRSRFYRAPPAAGPTLISSERDALAWVQGDEWLNAPFISDSASLNILTSVLRSADPRTQDDKLSQTFRPRDELFVGTLPGTYKAGDPLLVVRLTRNTRGLGWVVEPQGVVRIDSIADNTAKAIITAQFSNLRVGDLVMPMPKIPPMPVGNMTDVTGGPTGPVIDFYIAQPLVGTTEYVFVGLNSTQGIAIGDELLAYVPERQPTERSPERLPEQPVALMRVIRVNERAATARVVRLYAAALEVGLPVRVARKAP